MDELYDLNKYLEYFYKINPLFNFSNKTQRSAMQRILNKLGEEKTKGTLEYVLTIQGKKFAPIITTPLQLEYKLGELIAYFKKNNSNQITKVV